MIELSIIFPVHNESEGIKSFISKVYKSIKKDKINFEIICIENGSTDNSFSLLKSLEKKYKNISVHQSEKGWGNAVQKGIHVAKGKLICYMVSDNQIDPKYIQILYNKMKREKISVAKISRISRENILRYSNSKMYNIFATVLFSTKSMDINGTPKIIKSSLIRKRHFISKNISFDLELLIYLKSKNVSWVEIPVHSFKRKTGFSSTNIKSIWEMLTYMYQFRFKKTVK